MTAATNGWGNHPSRSTIAGLIASHSARYGVDPALVRAVAWQESGWWQGSRSSSGAIGVMQLMPGDRGLARPVPASAAGSTRTTHRTTSRAAPPTSGTCCERPAPGAWRSRRTTRGMGSVSTRGLLPETEAYVTSVASFIGSV